MDCYNPDCQFCYECPGESEGKEKCPDFVPLRCCPFCGSINVSVEKGFIKIPKNKDDFPDGFRVNCHNCFPHAYDDSEEEAIKSWNKTT